MGAGALSPPTGDRPEAEDEGEGREDGHRFGERTRERAERARDRTRERSDQVRERARERTEAVRDRTREQTERARMTVQRLFGIDRSGPPPPETLPGEPLRIWTIPNVVGLIRLAFIPVFLVVALASDTGTHVVSAVLFAAIAGTDYLDGFLARATGQYSRFGALLDPVTDRSLVLAGGIVCWYFDLLPRWALAILVAREVYLLAAGRMALSKGLRLQINWWGRLAVWPTMGGLFAALVGVGEPARIALVIGVAMSLVAAVLYTRDARRALRAGTATNERTLDG